MESKWLGIIYLLHTENVQVLHCELQEKVKSNEVKVNLCQVKVNLCKDNADLWEVTVIIVLLYYWVVLKETVSLSITWTVIVLTTP